jgi:hypothetical protein
MSAHTPGPWRYDYEDGHCGEIISSDGNYVFTFVDEPNETNEPNARLIAAAPNLLDAALRVLSHKRGEDDWLILAVDCRALEKAIAKATGGAL